MKVLTLSSEDLYTVTEENLQTEKYDKIVINDAKYVVLYVYTTFSKYVAEIESTNCVLIDEFNLQANNCKFTFKNTKFEKRASIECNSSTIIMDNCSISEGISIKAKKGISNFSFLNNSDTSIEFGGTYSQFGTITISNCRNLNVSNLLLHSIPSTEISTFMDQFNNLYIIVDTNMISANNYEISQADWDKAINLLNQYPSHPSIILNPDFINTNDSSNIYYHIPSSTFPLPWLNSLLLGFSNIESKLIAFVLLNKDGKPNFTVTHISNSLMYSSFISYKYPFFIANNYDDVAKYYCEPRTNNGIITNGPIYYNPTILSGKLVKSEITIIPNSLVTIETIDQNMRMHTTKVKTGESHGKTVKFASMEPFGILKIFGSTAIDVYGELPINRIQKDIKCTINIPFIQYEIFDGYVVVPSITHRILDGTVNIAVQTNKDIDGSAVILGITHHNLDGNINIISVHSKSIDGSVIVLNTVSKDFDNTVDIAVPTNKDIDGTANIAAQIHDINIDGSVVVLNTQKYIIGNITVQQAITTEISGSIEISMEEVHG